MFIKIHVHNCCFWLNVKHSPINCTHHAFISLIHLFLKRGHTQCFPAKLSFNHWATLNHCSNPLKPHLTVCAGISASLGVLRPVVPEKTHHQLSWGGKLGHTHTQHTHTRVNNLGHMSLRLLIDANTPIYSWFPPHHHQIHPLPVLGSSHSADILATYGRDFFLGPDRSSTVSLTCITSPSLSTPS